MMELTSNVYGLDDMVIEEDTADFTLTPVDAEPRCEHCGEQIVEYVDGWVHDGGTTGAIGDPRICGTTDRDDIRYELDLEDDTEVTDEMILEETDHTLAAPGEKSGAEMVNWVGMTINERGAGVQISVGDLRGCFEMRIWKGTDGDGNPCLYLSTPHPDDSAPHVKLEHHYNGVYRIVGY